MSKYIDANKLISEIERREAILNKYKDSFETAACCKHELEWMKDFITSLHQEQPEADLEKDIDIVWKKCNPIDEGMGVESAYIHVEAFDIIARHFYELGLNARKEE